MREHEIESSACWCNPQALQLCPECDGAEGGCWRCQDGLIACDAPDLYDGAHGLIFVHNDADDPTI